MAEDFDAWATQAGDEEAMRHMGGVQPRSVAWRGFLQAAGAWTIQGFSMFSVFERTSDRWIGRVGPWWPEGWPGPEIGWSLSRDAWGKGYATEAAAAAMTWAFDQLAWTRAIHSIAPDNVASQEVAKRLGSRLIGPGHLPTPYEDSEVEIWGQSRDEWRSGRR